MNILIIRNSSYDKSGDVQKVVEALTLDNHRLFVITRNRKSESSITHQFQKNSQTVSLYELAILDSKSIIGKMTNVQHFVNKGYQQVQNILNHTTIDYVHAFDLDAGLIAKKLYKKYGIPYNYHILDFYADSRNLKFKLLFMITRHLEYRVINNAQTTILCTFDRVQQIAGARPKKIAVIDNVPLNTGHLIPRHFDEQIFRQPLHICYIGTLTPNRFLFEVVEAVSNDPAITLVIGGRGSSASLLQEKCSHFKNIQFIGEVKYEDTFKYYANCNLMIAIFDPKIPNHQYSAPNKIYEAMLLGKPLITAKNTGLDYFIHQLKIGFEIDYNLESFQTLLNQLKQQPDSLIEKAQNSFHAYTEYTWEKIKDEYIKLYK